MRILFLQLWKTAARYSRVSQLRAGHNVKLHYGCGDIRQPGYVNVDLRWTPAVDFIADLPWCARWLEGRCLEVYMSHVLEHYQLPNRHMQQSPDNVLGALESVRRILAPGGIIRLAVPDFGALVKQYATGMLPLHPKLAGRICGGQEYRENVHRCVFDRDFLERCLQVCGYVGVQTWDPRAGDFTRDWSFDEIDGVSTSLNLIAYKPDS